MTDDSRYVTKKEMAEILDEIAEAIASNNSEHVRHLAWRLAKESEKDAHERGLIA